MHCIAVQTDYPQRDDDAATLMASIANPCYSSRSAGYKVQLTPRIIYSSMLLIPTLNYTTGTPLPLAASCYCNLYIYIYTYIHIHTVFLSFFPPISSPCAPPVRMASLSIFFPPGHLSNTHELLYNVRLVSYPNASDWEILLPSMHIPDSICPFASIDEVSSASSRPSHWSPRNFLRDRFQFYSSSFLFFFEILTAVKNQDFQRYLRGYAIKFLTRVILFIFKILLYMDRVMF